MSITTWFILFVFVMDLIAGIFLIVKGIYRLGDHKFGQMIHDGRNLRMFFTGVFLATASLSCIVVFY